MIVYIFFGWEHHWGYPYDVNEWGAVSSVCATGVEQSPIDLPCFSEADSQDALDINWNAASTTMADTGHTLKWVITLLLNLCGQYISVFFLNLYPVEFIHREQ